MMGFFWVNGRRATFWKWNCGLKDLRTAQGLGVELGEGLLGSEGAFIPCV